MAKAARPAPAAVIRWRRWILESIARFIPCQFINSSGLTFVSILRYRLYMEILDAVERRIAARLAALRAEHGWPLEELSERTGISRATLSRIERGELSPTANMLGQLCAAYGWTLSRLIA